MIVVRLLGGLGNQMFQYAAGRRLAAQRNTTLKLDLTWLNDMQDRTGAVVRDYELGCFVFEPHFAGRRDLARLKGPAPSLKRRLYRAATGSMTMFSEPDTADFMPEVLTAPDNSFLQGYWQSAKYFEDAAEIIRRDLSFKPTANDKVAELAKQIAGVEAVALHIRRSDYISTPEALAMHGDTDLAYYQRAMARINKQVAKPHYFVFSDDLDWCRKNLKTTKPITFVEHGGKDFEDVRLMSLCHHNIIANSSFSWWGALLNSHKDKIICAPKKWFNDPNMNTTDRLPKEWIKL